MAPSRLLLPAVIFVLGTFSSAGFIRRSSNKCRDQLVVQEVLRHAAHQYRTCVVVGLKYPPAGQSREGGSFVVGGGFFLIKGAPVIQQFLQTPNDLDDAGYCRDSDAGCCPE